VIEDHLDRWGVTAESFQAGKRALERFRDRAESAEPFQAALIGAGLSDIGLQDFVAQLRQLPSGKDLPLVVLTQLGESASLPEREAEITAQLPKPLRVSELYNCLIGALSGGPLPVARLRQAAVSQVKHTGRGILIVDDNDINRFVAAEQVEQAGYWTATAEDGARAVEMAKTQAFAAILMDCQMPVMDGYSAAAEIRRWEAGKSRVPILALTAHAMPGEREKVLNAGMDDYLSKPLRPEALERMLRRHVRDSVAPASEEPSRSELAGAQCPVLEAGMPRSHKLVQLFLTQLPAQLSGVEAAIDAEDFELLEKRAHKMKGSCLALGAHAMARAAEALQDEASRRDVGLARTRAQSARDHFGTVASLLLAERPSVAPPPLRVSGAPPA
jgi:CheY-like chemotaxis protein/HPt (histidine-containing phosphotransfer) domain-containing protein